MTEELTRIPTTRIAVRISAMAIAGTFTAPSGVMDCGSAIPKKLLRIFPKYPDHPTETADAPTINSRIRSHPMIQATNSPIEA